MNRLLAETRKLLEDLEDSKFLDEIIAMLNAEIPIIHREWKWCSSIRQSSLIPVEEGVMVKP